MSKIYQWFLWYSGFQEDEWDGDTISNMLARQKERMGWVWWVLSVGTLFVLSIFLAFGVWLTVHIVKKQEGATMEIWLVVLIGILCLIIGAVVPEYIKPLLS